YQVNFTFDMIVRAGCSPEALYLYLRQQQATPYCAFLKNKDDLILSFSPELFIRRSGEKIWSRPMKGTAARGITPPGDRAQKTALASDKKNRAENLMIVDLLRNDFGRICQTGTVQTPSLFDVETHPTLHQMTSLIEGRLRPEMSYLNIFESLFPCGSVTGAPKLKTMEIIQQIEEGRRGVYCGAIGYISPEKEAVFSVPIRILQQREDRASWQYRVGGGVVWDSRCRGEWNEAGLKSSFLTRNQVASFSLIETMLWKNGGLVYGPQHLKRLKNSARELGIKCKTWSISGVWAEMLTQLRCRPQAMVRFIMDQNGACCFEIHTRGLSQSKGACLVRISNVILDAQNVWLRHKTTYRPWYEATMKKISGKKVWDELFFNQHGQLCEGARSNVFVRLGTQLYTPPVSCGLLPGILRQDLLAQGKCQERMLTRNDVLNADELFCGNSVRGLQKVIFKK
ncbi:MAG TPA: chorismate-binding protein, partial [Candidatus Bathyarchaeia archaeon]|nr:chorismate-binding protein [Candidatus Bathyarchaeia archaeon]